MVGVLCGAGMWLLLISIFVFKDWKVWEIEESPAHKATFQLAKQGNSAGIEAEEKTGKDCTLLVLYWWEGTESGEQGIQCRDCSPSQSQEKYDKKKV